MREGGGGVEDTTAVCKSRDDKEYQVSGNSGSRPLFFANFSKNWRMFFPFSADQNPYRLAVNLAKND